MKPKKAYTLYTPYFYKPNKAPGLFRMSSGPFWVTLVCA
jgi:hypothetical protein